MHGTDSITLNRAAPEDKLRVQNPGNSLNYLVGKC
jgi:hypothetical protein